MNDAAQSCGGPVWRVSSPDEQPIETAIASGFGQTVEHGVRFIISCLYEMLLVS